MPVIHHTAFIGAEPGAVFDLISRVEDFSRYSDVIRSVQCIAPDTYRWTVNIAGVPLTWDAVVTDKQRPRRFAWSTVRGVENGGVFVLAPADGGTEVRFTMRYRFANPLLEGLMGAIAAPLMRRVAVELLERIRARLERATTS